MQLKLPQFFLGVIPSAGSRMRAHSTADIVGQNSNSIFDDISPDGNLPDDEKYEEAYKLLTSSEWVVTDLVNRCIEQTQLSEHLRVKIARFGCQSLNPADGEFRDVQACTKVVHLWSSFSVRWLWYRPCRSSIWYSDFNRTHIRTAV
jgi:hypothetical protein